MEGDEGRSGKVNAYITKHQNKMTECSKKEVKSFFEKPSSSLPHDSNSDQMPEPVVVNLIGINRNISPNEEHPLIFKFLEATEVDLSKSFLTDLVLSNNIVITALKQFCSCYFSLRDKIKMICDMRQRSKETQLTLDLNEYKKMIKQLKETVVAAANISTSPSLGFSSLRQNLDAKEEKLKEVVAEATKITSFANEKHLNWSIHRRVTQLTQITPIGNNISKKKN